MSGLTARTIVGQLASPVRMRVVAALILGAGTPAEVAAATGLPDEDVIAALGRLTRSGLVVVVSGRLAVRETAIAEAARAESPKPAQEDFLATDPAVRKVLRSFIVDGRLISIPAAGRKRRIILEYLASAFEPGSRYSEVQVNAILRSWHDDVAALRRYLVEEGLLSRDEGEYWRSGGWVDVLAARSP